MKSERIFLYPAGGPLRVQVAQTMNERQQGLQNVESLGDSQGMLFEYPYPSSVAFWMRHTPLDLTIAWFDKSGNLLGFEDMEAHSELPITAPQPFSSVLEVPQHIIDFTTVTQLRRNRLHPFNI